MMITVTAVTTLLRQQMMIIMITMLRMVIRRIRWDELTYLNLLCFESHRSLQPRTSPFSCWYYSVKCVLLWCSSVSDVAQPQHILSACQRCCCLNYFGDVVWIWRIIALKCAMSASGRLHYMKSNRWLSTTCAICWGDLSDFRSNNCQRNEGANRKAISSDSDSIALWRRKKTKGLEWKKISNIIQQRISMLVY